MGIVVCSGVKTRGKCVLTPFHTNMTVQFFFTLCHPQLSFLHYIPEYDLGLNLYKYLKQLALSQNTAIEIVAGVVWCDSVLPFYHKFNVLKSKPFIDCKLLNS